MNLLDVFKKSKKSTKPGYLGMMWVCVVKFQPWSNPEQRYDVMIKNVGVVEASMLRSWDQDARITSNERNPFGAVDSINLAGPVGCLKYVQSANIWVGFFETEDEAKEGYNKFVSGLVAEIKSAFPKT